jgi:metallo-beta-lactamase family protein
MSATLDFLGGAGTVTGSRFVLTTPRSRLMVDCGLFQGLRELRRRNWDPLPLDPATLSGVVVSHAHLDHSGYLPVLTRDGFSGAVNVTANTAKLIAIVLRDSAHLLLEDTEHARARGYSRHAEPRPLYTEEDVEKALAHLHNVAFGAAFGVGDDVEVKLQPAGHILGSASVLARWTTAERRVLFSGDLGRSAHPLLRPPPPPPAADVVVVESTYGDRRHEDRDGDEILAAAITRTARRGGSVVIPAFAVDRTEVILMALRRLTHAGAIPDLPVYVDSPMALASLAVYRAALASNDEEVRDDVAPTPDPFDPGDLRPAHSVEESKRLNDPPWPCVIVSASGMASGGRILHHLRGLLPRPENTVVLVGYQAVGTRGRQLLDGATALKIHGRYVPVRAEVVDVPMFSVHADANEIVAWLAQSPAPPETCYVVHGEPAAAAALSRRIRQELGWNAVAPTLGERVLLG